MKVIDISEYQGNIDYDVLKTSDVEGVIIRIGIGSDIMSQDDKYALRNIEECERVGLPYGVYLYSYALNIEEAHSEASHMLRIIEGHNPILGVYIDMEDADNYRRSHNINPYYYRQLMTDIARIFCEILSDKYTRVGVYANYDWWTNVLYSEQLEQYDRWLAHWGIDEPSMPCDIWQYSSDGEVSGIGGRVDMNIAYINIDSESESELSSESDSESESESNYNSGDVVKVMTDSNGNVYDSNGALCHCWYEEYTVIDTNNDGVCIGVDEVVFARLPYNKVYKEV